MLNINKSVVTKYNISTAQDTIATVKYDNVNNIVTVQQRQIKQSYDLNIDNNVYIEYKDNPSIYSIL
jgi:hypothetical protein